VKVFLLKNKWPLLIAATAVLVRIIYLVEISQQPSFSIPAADEQWYWLWAKSIVEKSFWGEGSYFGAPFYPYFLALLRFITGGSIFWSKLLQVLLCGGTAFFIFKTAQYLLGNETAVLSGLIYAFYGTLVFYESMFLPPVIFLLLATWAMYRLVTLKESKAAKSWILTGIIFGLAALATPNILLVIPFLALWLVFIHKKTSERLISATKLAALMIIGLIIAIVPVTVRNALVTGDFTLISTHSGINFYLGNNAYADGLTIIMPEIEPDNSISWDKLIPVIHSLAENKVSHGMSDAEISAYWTEQAIDFISDHPGKFLALLCKKMVYLASGYENSDATDIFYQRSKSVLFSILVWDLFLSFPFGLLLPLAIVSVYVLRHDFQKLIPLYIFIVAYMQSILLFLVTAKDRLPIIPFLIIFAASGIVRFFQTVKEQNLFKKGALAIALVICIVVLNQKFFNLGSSHPFFVHYDQGLTFQNHGDFEKAEQEYLQAHRAFPFSAALAVSLAEVQLKLNKIDEADRNLTRAIELKPQLAMSYNNLGMLVRGKGDLDSAVILFKKAIERHNPNASRPNEIGEYYVNLANTYKQLGINDSAALAYSRAMEMTPLFPKAFYQAALFFAELERFDISDSLYESAAHVKPADASEKFDWGMSYIQREMYNEGVGMMRGVLKMDDKFYQAWYVIAAVYNRVGEPKDSVNLYLNKCLALEPSFEPAVELKKQLRK